MIRSRLFWAAAICLAAIPLLAMDIPKHYIDWTREVHDEMIYAVQGQYKLNTQQRADILDNILETNNKLMAKMYIKSFAVIVLLVLGISLFTRYQQQHGKGLKAIGICITMLVVTVGIKFYLWMRFTGSDQIQFLTLRPADTSITAICKTHFKNKVVYVDFWGTTCGPCLEEFRNFTPPLKQRFKSRGDIAYLYVCAGHQVMWKQQIQKFNVTGTHLFLNDADYSRFFRQAVKGDKDSVVAMPRYIIISKNGEATATNAPRPSDITALITLLTKQLTDNLTITKSQTYEQHI